MPSVAQAAEWVTTHEILLRGVCFVAVFAPMVMWEIRAPARKLRLSKGLRWVNNLGLVALNTLLMRFLFPVANVGLAAFAAEQGWGVLNYFACPFSMVVIVSVIALDFVIWLQHVLVHAIPLMWRIHRVHHADPDYDLTTGVRFHPFEILFSTAIKWAGIVLLGAPVVAVILFEVLLNGTAMFNHANVRLPTAIDRVLRWLVVTPDMHRVHHSIEADETNSNFGFNLPWWDRLFGTYREQPRGGHESMTIGIRNYSRPRDVTWLPGLLALPFRADSGGYDINSRSRAKPGIE